MCPRCGGEEEVVKIVESRIDIVMAYLLHRNFLNITHAISLVSCLFFLLQVMPGLA